MTDTLTGIEEVGRRSSVRGTLAMLVGGSLIGQIMAAASTPLITRIYQPDRLGQVAIFSTVLTAGAVVSTLGFEKAVPLPSDDAEATRLVRLAMRLSIPLAILITLVAMRAFPQLDGADVALLLVGGLIAVALFNIGLALAIRRNDMADIARTRALQGAGQSVIQVVGGVMTAGGFIALGLGIVAARCFGAVTLLRGWRTPLDSEAATNGDHSVGRLSQRRLAGRYRAFAMFSMPGSLANSLSLLLPPMLVALEFGVERGGLFTISSRLAMLPAIVLSGALTPAYLEGITRTRRNVLAGDMAEHAGSDAARRTYVTFVTMLLALGAVAAIVVAIGARWAAGLLGENWADVGTDLHRLLPVVLLQPAASTISQTLNAIEQNRGQFAWEATRLALLTAVVVGSARLGYSALTAITGVGLVLAGSYLAIMWLSWRALGKAAIVPGEVMQP